MFLLDRYFRHSGGKRVPLGRLKANGATKRIDSAAHYTPGGQRARRCLLSDSDSRHTHHLNILLLNALQAQSTKCKMQRTIVHGTL